MTPPKTRPRRLPKLPAKAAKPKKVVAVARDLVNKLGPSAIFVLFREPALSGDSVHLVPSKKSKNEPKTERASITKDHTAVRFLNVAANKHVYYDFIYARGTERNLAFGAIAGENLTDESILSDLPAWITTDRDEKSSKFAKSPSFVAAELLGQGRQIDETLKQNLVDLSKLDVEEPKP